MSINKATITDEHQILMNQIIGFGFARGFDFKTMTPESLDQLMKDWIESGRQFHQAITDADFADVKRMLNL